TFNIGTLATTESIAELTTAIAQKLGDGISTVSVESPQGPKISFDQKDRRSLGSPRGKRAAKRLANAARRPKEPLPAILRAENLEAVVDILSFDKVRRTGTLLILQSGQLPLERFSFELARRPETESAIAAMLQPRVSVICQIVGKHKLELLRV